MKRKKILASFLSAAMAITAAASGMGTVVSAYEADGISDNELQLEFVDDNNFVELENQKVNPENATFDDFNLDLSKGHELPMTTAALDMETYYGTLTETNDLAYLIKALEPGEIINTTLICPLSASLDYDIMLCECDPDTGDVGDLLVVSNLATYFNTYPDNTRKTADESISYINRSNTTKYYYIIIFSSQGYSTMYNFQLTVSITEAGDYDIYEPNDSINYPINVTAGIVPNLSLHAENDYDWYKYTAPTTETNVSISTSVAGYDIEVYRTNTSYLILESANANGNYTFKPNNIYYIRVYSSMSNFVARNYTLTIAQSAAPPQVGSITLTSFSGDMESTRVTYAHGALFRFKNQFTLNLQLTASDGTPLSGQTVDVDWISGAWSVSSGNYSRTASGITDSLGRVSITIKTPTAIGNEYYLLSGAMNFVHYYDLDTVQIRVGTSQASMKLYHYAYGTYVNS